MNKREAYHCNSTAEKQQRSRDRIMGLRALIETWKREPSTPKSHEYIVHLEKRLTGAQLRYQQGL